MIRDTNQEVEIVRVTNGYVVTFGNVSVQGFGESFVYVTLDEMLEAVRDYYTPQVLSCVGAL